MTSPLERLAEIQQHMARLQRVASAALAVPASPADAADRTNSVTVSLDANGLPQTIRLNRAWRSRIRGADLSGAVMEAAQKAGAKRMNAWTQEIHARGITKAAQNSIPFDPTTEKSPQTFESNPPHSLSDSPPRPLNLIFKDALSRIETLEKSGTGTSSFRSEAASGKISVELSPQALLTCHIDPDWADHQTDRTINAALADAVAKARQALTASDLSFNTTSSRPEAGLQGVLGELLNFLQGANERPS